jgi:hypothetical protein
MGGYMKEELVLGMSVERSVDLRCKSEVFDWVCRFLGNDGNYCIWVPDLRVKIDKKYEGLRKKYGYPIVKEPIMVKFVK